jgi:hypothetical protein
MRLFREVDYYRFCPIVLQDEEGLTVFAYVTRIGEKPNPSYRYVREGFDEDGEHFEIVKPFIPGEDKIYILELVEDVDELEDGERVVLAYPPEDYDLGENNPAIGQPEFCYGTVNGDEGSGAIIVEWDNGHQNVYCNDELARISQVVFDREEGNYMSIWTNF